MQRKMYDATGHCETGVTVVHHVTAVVVVNYAGDDVADGETWEMAFFAWQMSHKSQKHGKNVKRTPK